MKYTYLWAWDTMMGSHEYWKEDNQAYAEKDNAPLDAVYWRQNRQRNGREWVRIGDIKSAETRECVQRIADQYHEILREHNKGE